MLLSVCPSTNPQKATITAGGTASVSFYNKLKTGSVKLVKETNTGGDGSFLRIGAGAVVQSIDAAVSMSQLLHIVGACGQTGNRNFAAGIGGVGTSSQRSTGAVGIDPKLPAGKIITIHRVPGYPFYPFRFCIYL